MPATTKPCARRPPRAGENIASPFSKRTIRSHPALQLIDKYGHRVINFGMRIFSLFLFSLLCAACSTTEEAAKPDLKIKEIMPRYIETEDFKRISEYMTGKENPGRRVIVRTNPRQRDGFYFILILDRNVRKLPPDAYVVGEFYTADSVDLKSHRFNLPSILPGTRELFLGLTGEDWPQKDVLPSAWRFTIKNSREEVLARKQSYLWSL